MKTNYALGIIDVQHGFMPEAEGVRLGLEGFGELPIRNGEQVVEPINKLLGKFAVEALPVFTSQDWHPEDTAHFSDNPNFVTTWPRHCVMFTPGAKLHPELKLPIGTVRFVKGFNKLERSEDDTSYSAFNAAELDPLYAHNRSLVGIESFMSTRQVDTLVLGGLALDYCVGKTALDFRQKRGLDVIVAVDATRAVSEETGRDMLAEFARNGIQTLTTDQILEMVS